MTRFTRLALSAALLAIAVPATLVTGALPAAAQDRDKKAKPPKLKPEFQKPMAEAQKLAEAKDFQGALAKTQEVEASVPNRTPYEEFLLRETQVQIYNGLKDMPNLGKAIEASLATGQMPAEQVPKREKIVGQLALQNKEWAKASTFLGRYAASAPTDFEARYALAQSYYFAKDQANTTATIKALINDARAAGQPLQPEWLQLPLRMAVDSQNRGQVITALMDIIAVSPTPAYWRDLLNQVQAQKLSDKANLNVIRLKEPTGAQMQDSDYLEIGELAMRLGLPGEARSNLEKGLSVAKFTPSARKYANDALTQARGLAATDEKSLAAQEKSAAAAKTGQADVAVGLAYMSYGNNAKAIELIERGIGKGGVRDMDDANISLGIAKYRNGDLAGAITAFDKVRTNPQMAQVASLWSLHAKTKLNPPATQAAATAQ